MPLVGASNLVIDRSVAKAFSMSADEMLADAAMLRISVKSCRRVCLRCRRERR